MVGAASDASVIGAEAGLPVHGVVGNAALVVGSTGRARGERHSVLVPGAGATAGVVGLEAGLPVVWVFGHALGVGGGAREARSEGHSLGSEGAAWNAGVVGVQARLPVSVVSGDTALIVSCTGGASGEGLGGSVCPRAARCARGVAVVA